MFWVIFHERAKIFNEKRNELTFFQVPNKENHKPLTSFAISLTRFKFLNN